MFAPVGIVEQLTALKLVPKMIQNQGLDDHRKAELKVKTEKDRQAREAKGEKNRETQEAKAKKDREIQEAKEEENRRIEEFKMERDRKAQETEPSGFQRVREQRIKDVEVRRQEDKERELRNYDRWTRENKGVCRRSVRAMEEPTGSNAEDDALAMPICGKQRDKSLVCSWQTLLSLPLSTLVIGFLCPESATVCSWFFSVYVTNLPVVI